MGELDTFYIRALILEDIQLTVADAVELGASLDSAATAERMAAIYIGGMTKSEIVAEVERVAERAAVQLCKGDISESIAFFVRHPLAGETHGG